MTWPVLGDHVAVARVDGQLVLVDRESGQLLVADRVGALVIESRDLFTDLDDAVAALHDALGGSAPAIRRELRTIARTLRPRPSKPSRSGAWPRRLEAAAPSGQPSSVSRVDCLGLGMEVRCYTAELAEIVPPLLEAHPPTTVRDHVVELWLAGDSLHISVDGTSAGVHADLWSLVSHLLAEIMIAVRDAPSPDVRLHAGCVARHGRGLALGGGPGQGKSSTVLELVRRGAAYVTDELVELDAESRAVRGFARPIGLDGQVRARYPRLRPPWWDDEWWYTTWPVAPAAVGNIVDSAPLAGFAILEYSPGAPTRVTELAPVDALARVCPLVYNPAALTSGVLATLGELLGAIPVIEVRHGGGSAAADALLEAGVAGWL